MTIRIRPATTLDAPAIADAHRSSWEATYRDIVSDHLLARHVSTLAETWQAQLISPDATATWVATHEGDVVGFITVESMGPGFLQTLRVNALYVTPQWTGQGCGTALLDYATSDVPAYTGCVAQNVGALRFWQTHGFMQVSHAVDERFGVDIVTLVRD